MKRLVLVLTAALMLIAMPRVTVRAATNTCNFASDGTTWTLQGDCVTDATILIPVANLNGNGFAVRAVDPSGGHFRGAVIQAGTETLNVDSLNVTSSGLADVCDAGADRLRGIMWQGASGSATNVVVDNVNQGPIPTQPSGCQEGNAFEVRNFGDAPTTTHVSFDSVTASHYQKTGVVCNGDVTCTVTDSKILGSGRQAFTAQNGIQLGFGATGSVKRSEISGNAYTGNSAVSGGILVVAGPFYGSGLSVGDQVMNNILKDNDIGVWLSQINADESAPATQTNAKVVGNVITNSQVSNGYGYQAGVADQGNNDKIINNTISGAGYTSAGVYTIDAATTFTNRPKVHANK